MQGTAADIVKLAMRAVYDWLPHEACKVCRLLRVHDELMLEVPDAELERVRVELPQVMADVAHLKVPLLVEAGWCQLGRSALNSSFTYRQEMHMEYRRLGRSGLKVSALSFGSWVTYSNQLDTKLARECMATARDAGVNFFDNAEVYAQGESERIMGQALRELGWAREHYIVSSKFFWGLTNDPNVKQTLNRKYLLAAVDGSLRRFGLDYIDLVYCHRPDPHTPVEETVWAMHDIINRGKALPWDTSEWSAGRDSRRPGKSPSVIICTSPSPPPPFFFFFFFFVEQEYRRLYEDIGLGLTAWGGTL